MLLERAMLALLTKILVIVRRWLWSQARLRAEILVLRQQVLILSRKRPARVRLRNLDRLILVWLYRFFPSILNAIVVVKPETVIRWHRRGFRAYWQWKREMMSSMSRLNDTARNEPPSERLDAVQLLGQREPQLKADTVRVEIQSTPSILLMTLMKKMGSRP